MPTVRQDVGEDGRTIHRTDEGESFKDGFAAVIMRRTPNGFTEGWIAMAQNPLEELAKQNLGEIARVLFKMLASAQVENYILLSQAEMADQIGMKRPSFARALKKLLEIGIVEAGPKTGKSRSFKINPDFAWKGKGKRHIEELKNRARTASRHRRKKPSLRLVKSEAPAPLPEQTDIEEWTK